MEQKDDRSFWLWLAVMAVFGGAVVYGMSAPFGLGIVPDSVTYLQGAKYLALGQGFLTYDKAAHLVAEACYPPGLSVLLSLAWFLGMSFVEWARILNSVFLGGNVFLAGVIVFYVTRSRSASLMTAGIFLISVHILEAHGKLISEPLFLFLLLGWFWAMLVFVDTGSRRALYTAALCAGLSVLARYSGVPVIIAGVLWLLFREREEGKLRDTGLFLLAAGIFPMVLFVRNVVLAGAPLGRSYHVVPQGLAKAATTVNSFSELLLPARIPLPLRWAILVVFFWLAGRWVKANWLRLKPEVKSAMSLMSVFSLIYFMLGMYFILFTGGDSVFNHRLLLPVYVFIFLGAGLLLPLLRQPWTPLKKTVAVVLAVFCAVALMRSVQLAGSFYGKGYEYASKAITTSKLTETLRSIDDRVPLYSNEPQAAYYFCGRPAVKIPSLGEDASYFPAMPLVARDFKEQRAVAVIFDARLFVPSATWTEMKGALGLEPLMKEGTGVIYGVKKK